MATSPSTKSKCNTPNKNPHGISHHGKRKPLRRARRNGGLRPKDEAFCRDVAAGMSATQAYRVNIAEFQIKTTSAQSEAYKLMQKPEICLCIAKLRDADKRTIEEKLGFGREQAMRELLEVWHTPIVEIDETHRFCQEQTVTAGEEFTQTKTKSVSKMDAMEKMLKILQVYPTTGAGGSAPPVIINLGSMYSPALGEGEAPRTIRIMEANAVRVN